MNHRGIDFGGIIFVLFVLRDFDRSDFRLAGIGIVRLHARQEGNARKQSNADCQALPRVAKTIEHQEKTHLQERLAQPGIVCSKKSCAFMKRRQFARSTAMQYNGQSGFCMGLSFSNHPTCSHQHCWRKNARVMPFTDEEIRFLIGGFCSGEVADYQMSALAMAICIQGMDSREVLTLTRTMLESGDLLPRGKTGEVGLASTSTAQVGLAIRSRLSWPHCSRPVTWMFR